MKVGDYVRTKRGIIGKIKLIDNQTELEDLYLVKRKWYYKKDFIKSSPNIIDLIEVGDYVNGQKVHKNDEYDYLYLNGIDGDGNCYEESLKDIKSIVTKEQFEEMEYKL